MDYPLFHVYIHLHVFFSKGTIIAIMKFLDNNNVIFILANGERRGIERE